MQSKIVTWSLLCVCLCVCACVFTFIVYLFLNSLAQFSGGVQTATIHVRRDLFFCAATSEHLNFGLFGLWLSFVLKSAFFICNNCILIFSRSSNSRVFFFSPPPPHFYIHSWTILLGKAPWWKDQDTGALTIRQCFP